MMVGIQNSFQTNLVLFVSVSFTKFSFQNTLHFCMNVEVLVYLYLDISSTEPYRSPRSMPKITSQLAWDQEFFQIFTTKFQFSLKNFRNFH